MRRNISATVLRSKSDQYEMLCGIFMENLLGFKCSRRGAAYIYPKVAMIVMSV